MLCSKQFQGSAGGCLSTNRCPLAVATPIGVVLVHPESAVLPRHACGRLTKQLFVCPYNLPEREASLCFSPDSRARPSKSKSTDHLSGPSGSSLLLRARDVERLVLAHAPRRMLVTFRFNVPRLTNGSSLCKRPTFQPSATRAAMCTNTAGFKSRPRPMTRLHRQPLNKRLNNTVLIEVAMRHHRLSVLTQDTDEHAQTSQAGTSETTEGEQAHRRAAPANHPNRSSCTQS